MGSQPSQPGNARLEIALSRYCLSSPTPSPARRFGPSCDHVCWQLPPVHQPWDENPDFIGKPAVDLDSCAFRCHCGVAFSNARLPASRICITRSPQLNVPPEARAGLEGALGGACNIADRTVKRQKFCSANSEDAVTWTVVRGLLQAELVGSLVSQPELGAPQALLLWGTGLRSDSNQDRVDDVGLAALARASMRSRTSGARPP